MNERIQELLHQCSVPNDQAENYSKSKGLVIPDQKLDVAKFAGLIVKECMACATWVGKMNTNSSEPIQTAHAINQRIKQQFGVEE